MNYLIPANSKKSLLYFGLFSAFDLILFGVGLGLSLLLLVVINPSSFAGAMIDLAPGLITGFLVLPIPNYHNTLTVIKDLYLFYTSRQRFIWKGWCVKDDFKPKQK